MDAGVAGLTVGGAGIGSLVCPGPGTLIGGAIGAGVGIVGSIFSGDTVKEWGEEAGGWLEDKGKEAGEWISQKASETAETISDGISSAKEFVTSWFR
ncbi:hypothetical protein AAG663_01350 [Bacillus licheniformis]